MIETLTQREESLTARVRSEMLTHYGEMTKEVEVRQARAEWRLKRMNLQEIRVQFLESEERRWRDDSKGHGEDKKWRDDRGGHDEGEGELVLSLHDHQQVLPSSHDHNTTSHDQDNASHDHDNVSHDFSSLKEAKEDRADLASDRESTPPSEHANLLAVNQQIPDVHSELHSTEHQISSIVLSQPLTSSAKELTNKQSGPDEKVNEQGYPRLFSTRGQAPRSTVETILYGSEEPLPQEAVSTRGCAPPSTIQHLLYPLRHATPTNLNQSDSHDNRDSMNDDSAELVELGPSSKFTDQYDLLGEYQHFTLL